jgi:hypothetical protein
MIPNFPKVFFGILKSILIANSQAVLAKIVILDMKSHFPFHDSAAHVENPKNGHFLVY